MAGSSSAANNLIFTIGERRFFVSTPHLDICFKYDGLPLSAGGNGTWLAKQQSRRVVHIKEWL